MAGTPSIPGNRPPQGLSGQALAFDVDGLPTAGPTAVLFVGGAPPPLYRHLEISTGVSMDTSDIKKGLKLLMDGHPYVVTDFQFVKPGKGQAFTRTKLKNMLTGNTIDRNIRSGEKLEPADVEDRTLQYIYPEGEMY